MTMDVSENAATRREPVRPAWMDEIMATREESASYGESKLLDLGAIRGFLWRQRFILTGVIALALIIGYISTVIMTPIYTASATVRIDPEATAIVEGQDTSDLRGGDVTRYIQTLASVLQSRSMAYRVVDDLKLASNDAFLGDAIQPGSKVPASVRRDIAAGIVRGGLGVTVPTMDRILTINYRSTDRVMSARIADAYVSAFLTDDMRRSLEKNAYAQSYLSGQIDRIRGLLQNAERDALSYARANRIVGPSLLGSADPADASGGVPQTVAASNLANINTSYTQARAKRIAAEQRWRAVAGTSPLNLPEVQQNATVQGLISDKSKAASELADLRTRYGDSYPRILELKAQVSSIDQQVSRTGNEIKSGIRQAYEVALQEEQALSGELGKVSEDTLAEQDRRVAFNQLDRNAKALSAQLKSLLERYNQLTSAANVQTGTITKLDSAVVPGGPSSPNLSKNLFIALVVGAGVALGLALLRDILDDRLRSIEDVETKLGLQPLGVTPMIDMEGISEGWMPLGEAYSTIRTSIDFLLPRREHNVIMVTSSQQAEGKSTTSIALAKKFAQLNRRVLLIDADLRKPSVAAQFGQSRPKKGFVEVLLGDCTLEEALLPQDIETLDVLPVGAIPSNPVEVLSSQQIHDFIEKYRDQYSLIVLDVPPVMGLADAPLLSRLADGVVFIIESNRAHFGQAKAAVRRLRMARANMLGVILTKFEARESGYSYDYQYSYYAYGSDKK